MRRSPRLAAARRSALNAIKSIAALTRYTTERVRHMGISALREHLKVIGQEHLLTFWHELDDEQRGLLAGQIAALDFDHLPQWIDEYVRTKPRFELPAGIEPPVWYPRDPTSPRRPYDAARSRAAGEALIRAGKVAAFCVAGGQGTRLGWDGPKGTYPSTPITRKPLFQVFAEQLLAASKRWGRSIPLYVMTSPLNHEPTVEFFQTHNHFGLEPADIMFFQQGMMPSFDGATGRILLASKGELALNPDGHGGSLLALYRSGAIDDMLNRGVEHISYIQVDNPHVRVIDPLFIGLHATAEDSSGEMSSKMLPKTGPFEKLGNFCRVDGRTTIIEYSDLPDSLAEQRDERGELRFGAGSLAIHCIGVEFVRRLNTTPASGSAGEGRGGAGFALPFHRADKKVAHIDLATGQLVEPSAPNAVKLETFVFDALPLCESSIILETDRVEEFAPIKNLSGVDSAESSRALQIERAARWLEAAGVKIPRDAAGACTAVIEISPLTCLEAGDLLKHPELPPVVSPGDEVLL